MVSYHRPKSGHITCYLNRTYHVLLTEFKNWLGEYEAKCYRAVSMHATEQSGERLSLAPAETQTPELVARAYKPGS